MNTSGQHIDFELIARHISGETSPKEQQQLNTWMGLSEENRKFFEEYKTIWEKMDHVSPIAKLNLDAEWKKLESQLDNSTPVIFMATRIAVAAVVVIAMMLGGFYTSRNVGYHTMATDTASKEITLPDCSTVTLNRNSSLRYPKKFKKDQRGISLEGEGFFEVKENRECPFVLTTKEVDIRVLGTSFNVNAYETNEKIEVIVKTGQVAVTRHGEVPKTVILKPGSKAIFNKSKEDLSLSSAIDKNYLAWKTKSFVFEDQTLKEVAAVLNKVYRSEISIPSDSLKTAKITTTFSEQSLEAILNVLAATLDIEVVEFNGQILLKESN